MVTMPKIPQVLPHLLGLPWEKPVSGKPLPPTPPPPSQGGPPVILTPPPVPISGPPGQRPPPPPANTPQAGTVVNSMDPNAAEIYQVVMSSGYGTYSNRPQVTGSSFDLAECDVFFRGRGNAPTIAMVRGECKATITYGQATDKRFLAMVPMPYQGGVLRALFTPSDWQTSQGVPQRIDLECAIYATPPGGLEAPASMAYASLIIDPNMKSSNPANVPPDLSGL